MRTRVVSLPVVNGVRGRRRAELVEVARQPSLLELMAINLARLAWQLLAAATRQRVDGKVPLEGLFPAVETVIGGHPAPR